MKNQVVRLWAAVIPLALIFSEPAAADVVPPPPPYADDLALSLQRETIRRLGAEMNDKVHRSLSAIAVAGSYRASMREGPFNILVRTQTGWASWKSGKPRPLAAAVGAEIDRLLTGDNFWREDGFVYGYPCPGAGRVMQVSHRGRSKFSRQPCGPKGLAGRLADLAATERLPNDAPPPAGGREFTLMGARGSNYDGAPPQRQDPDAAELVMHLKSRSTYALKDGKADAFLEPYARDVTMIWPDRTERGLKALRLRASAATWYGLDRRNVAPGEAFLKETGPDSFTLTGAYTYWDGEKQFRLPFISYWQKRRGIWEIIREQMKPAEPVS